MMLWIALHVSECHRQTRSLTHTRPLRVTHMLMYVMFNCNTLCSVYRIKHCPLCNISESTIAKFIVTAQVCVRKKRHLQSSFESLLLRRIIIIDMCFDVNSFNEKDKIVQQ